MDFDDLTMFCAVVQEGSVTAAAARLCRVPSNVTTRIKNLELDLGAPLFIREKQRLRLSPSGERLLPYARKMLALKEEARGAVSCHEPEGSLTIGSMESAAAARLPAVLGAFHRLWPKVRLSLHTAPTDDLLTLLKAGGIDVAFVDLSRAEVEAMSLDLDACPAFDEELVLVTPVHIDRVAAPKDLDGLTTISFSSGCSYRRRLVAWLDEFGVAQRPTIEMSSYHGILACVAAGIGFSLVPRGVIAVSRAEEVACHPIRNGAVTTSMVWRRGRERAAIAALRPILRCGRGAELKARQPEPLASALPALAG